MCSLQIGGKLARTGLFDFFVHARVSGGDQLGDDVVALGHRIVGITARPEKIRSRNLVAPRERHRHHIKAVAVAGQVHHFEFGCGQRPRKPLATREDNRIQKLLRLQHRSDIEIEVKRVHANPFGVFARISC